VRKCGGTKRSYPLPPEQPIIEQPGPVNRSEPRVR